ncbi:MAG: DUF4279 domain-containing protein [Gammaproteobacteria bacterium]|nr:DUF4279 domain-containing protein [Gammaproteobacteria bacterium]
MTDYDDEYATCEETYATFRVFSEKMTPEDISSIIGTEPTKHFQKGDLRFERAPPETRQFHAHGWFYSTRGISPSHDCRRHLDILIQDCLADEAAIKSLQQRGCKTDITVYYVYTQGGPTISPKQMRALADVNVEVWWDLYRSDSDDIDSH